MNVDAAPTLALRILSPRDTAAKLGVSATTLQRIVADHDRGFPLAVQITERRIGYLEHEVDEWITARRKPPSRP